MSTRVMQYAHQSLAACGFVILDSTVAATLRPDLWSDGMASAGDFAQPYTQSELASIGSVQAWYFKFEEEGRAMKVLTRAREDLANRIRWITGRRIGALWQEAKAVTAQAPVIVARKPNPTVADRYAGQVTAEPGRTCSTCDAFTAGHTCSNVLSSGMERPAPNVVRRCLGYKPMVQVMDDRNGQQLWPELVTIKAIPAQVRQQAVRA